MIAPSPHRNGMPMKTVMAFIEAFRIAHERYDRPKKAKKRSRRRPVARPEVPPTPSPQ